ncbi:hypothetical protein [Dyadobacter sandarakinus]|uniref:Uncharacterized protein n=1 Tax=Dyadobacter sandarakinus TaxID=2747268 RepID=A0ABX7I784_9BACT|nr:hypothetical protein [Dyadobacter sandarakinus]QRR01961.1 hypothetical protein HWI92_14100 [Dyadobacter sandarakinus]
MSTQDLIKSGLVESFLLGFASKEEQELVRERALTDSQFNDYLADIESNVRAYFNGKSVIPPAPLREVIALRSPQKNAGKPKHEFQSADAGPLNGNARYHEIEVNDTHIKVHKYWRPAFIAVFILSKIFLIAGLYFYFKSQHVQDELNRLKAQTELHK